MRMILYQEFRVSEAQNKQISLAFHKLSQIWLSLMARRLSARSGCPVSISLEIFGDRWSLLIIRDLMVRGLRNFRDFQTSGEGIATNVLTDRLGRLQHAGIVTAEPDNSDRRKMNYRLTEKGIDLAPVMLELLLWAARHERTGAPREVTSYMEENRDQVLAEAKRRWLERDPTPLLPKFSDQAKRRTTVRKAQQ